MIKKAPLKTISFYDINDMGFSVDTVEWLLKVLGCGPVKVRVVVQALDEEDEDDFAILRQYEDSDNILIY